MDDRRVHEVLLELLDVPAEERQAFLDKACGGDRSLAAEVEAILACEDRLEGFLDQPTVADPSGSRAVAEPAPDSIGNYRIVEILGRGGMGTVYLAEQTEPIQRQVALKVISVGQVDDEAIGRFQAERQALARMSHPNIAHVFEAGATDDGQPYVVMEHVPGASIVHYCDSRKLGIEERIELLLEVCDGIRHAHEKGILHRDIKPSNIMVAEEQGRPLVKIIDFGIAKALDEPIIDRGPRTAAYHVVGTPGYVSPEAFLEDDLDTRYDVYALGLVLHVLLVGALPFEGSRSVLVRTPTAPSEKLVERAETAETVAANRGVTLPVLVRQVRGDLDWITLKALAPERDQRYASVAELAADLDRHRRNEPVLAGPDSRLYRLRRFVRRNRLAVTAATMVLLALAGGLAATTVAARRAIAEARRANREAEAARQVTNFLVTLFQEADPSRARGSTLTVKEVLDDGAARIEDELAEQPLIRATTMGAIGSVYANLGLFPQAEPLLQEALRLRQAELGLDHLDVAECLEDLASLYRDTGRFKESDEFHRRALRIREAEQGPVHPEIAKSLSRLAITSWSQGNNDEALQLLERAWEIQEAVLDPADPDRGMVLNNLGIVLEETGRFGEAEVRYRQALEIQEDAFGGQHFYVASIINNLANVIKAQGRYDEAESLYARALAIRENLLEADHPHIATSLNNLANLYLAQGELERAEPLLRRSLAISEAIYGTEHPDLAFCLNSLGTLHLRMGKPVLAEPFLERALALVEAGLGSDHAMVATCLYNLAHAAWGQDHLVETRQYLDRALETWERVLGPDHPDVASALGFLASLDHREGHLERAEARFKRALSIKTTFAAPGEEELNEILEGYAEVLRGQGRHEEAAVVEARITRE